MKSFINRLKRDDGFTLVELMVVVAIIGLLSAVAIPNFKKYQAKSKTSEAKLQLASLYTAETSWFSDYDNFSDCLNLMGFDPAPQYTARYYTIGFAAVNASGDSAAVNNGAPAACTGSTATTGATATASSHVYNTGKLVGGVVTVAATLTGQLAAATISATFDTFTAAAIGVVDNSKNTNVTADLWSITDSKSLRQNRIGY